MKRNRIRLTAMALFASLFLMTWFSADVSAEENGKAIDTVQVDKSGKITLDSTHAGSEGLLSLQLQLAVDPEKACSVEFLFEKDDIAKVQEFRYSQEGDMYIYLAGTEPLFDKGQGQLSLGSLMIRDENGNDVAADVWVKGLGYAYGTKVEEISMEEGFLDAPTQEKPAAVNKEPEETPEPPQDPQPPQDSGANQDPQPPQDSGANQNPQPPQGSGVNQDSAPNQSPLPLPGPASTEIPDAESAPSQETAPPQQTVQTQKPKPASTAASEPEENGEPSQEQEMEDQDTADQSSESQEMEDQEMEDQEVSGEASEDASPQETEQIPASAEAESSGERNWGFLAVMVGLILIAVVAAAVVLQKKQKKEKK